jgi:hypothetical protein
LQGALVTDIVNDRSTLREIAAGSLTG